ncbi:sigma factor-like helix-turn-helix DNA-binding protein [Streptomyces sp. MS1.AVA.3]|uniref:sigma factor-like helix-turn-helix DNA-binding protein n=1 Tax=Streptomyces decoyicus TaxID=249567 RepID=UPI0030BBA8CC
MTQREQAASAFDDLHARHAAALTQQTYLLTGRPRLARRAVEQGFRLAWQRWPQVAVDPDPAGWVRAAAYEYALTPWHRLCPGLRPARKPKHVQESGPSDRALLEALLSLPAPYRRALLLHDGLGMGLYETAAEIEASTPAAAGRLTHARERVAERLPELGLGGQEPVRQGEILRARLTGLAAAQQVSPAAAQCVRSGSERSDLRVTLAAVGLTGLFALATLVMMIVTPDHYTPSPDRPLATAPHTRLSPAPRHGADIRKQGNAAVRKRLRQARLTPDVR